MIDGNLSDVSLAGLLQLLATESNKTYRLRLSNGLQKGEVFISEGQILAANFGLLEGNDALCEFLFWQEGAFGIERLASRFKNTITPNLDIELKQVDSFADKLLFLQESQVGLNTEIVPSLRFGTQEWQESLTRHPLVREDFLVLGWVTDGRTMRQAMREFSFNVITAFGVLFRLLITGSVQVLRPSFEMEPVTERELPLAPSVFKPTDKVPESAGDVEVVKAESKVKETESLPQTFAVKEAQAAPEVQAMESSAAPAAQAAVTQEASAIEEWPAAVSFETKSISAKATADGLPAAGTPEFKQIWEEAQRSVQLNKAAAEAHVEAGRQTKIFDMRRTDPLPLVAIDIERLFQTTFKVSPFGHLALNNQSLDDDLNSLLTDYKAGKSLITVAFANSRVPGQALYSTKYLLERGHIEPPDQVVSLTTDLLLGRLELEQYLLQRRRITGDELRALHELACQKGLKMSELLVKMGFMTQSDWDRLLKEKEMFAPR
jgi:hypothetical protein